MLSMIRQTSGVNYKAHQVVNQISTLLKAVRAVFLRSHQWTIDRCTVEKLRLNSFSLLLLKWGTQPGALPL